MPACTKSGSVMGRLLSRHCQAGGHSVRDPAAGATSAAQRLLRQLRASSGSTAASAVVRTTGSLPVLEGAGTSCR